MNKRFALGGIALILVIGGFYVFGENPTGDAVQTNISKSDTIKKTEGITTGKLARDFSLTTIEGNTVKLSDFRGKYVVFAFMGTWCVPCQIEADNVRKVQDERDFVVIQIDIDSRETNRDLIDFRNEFGNKDWIMAFDKDFEIAKPYNVKSYDTTLIVDPEGKIVYRDEGWPIDVKTLKGFLKGEFRQLVLDSTHEHATITVTIKNEEIDFSQKKYQLKGPFVHFENEDGKTIHKHADGVTLNYLFGTLGWEYGFKLDSEKPCLKTDFGEICDGVLHVIVNGVKRSMNYEIKDNDVIEVAYE